MSIKNTFSQYKKTTRSILFVLIPILLCIGVQADGEITTSDNGTLLVDDFYHDLNWTTKGSADSISLEIDRSGEAYLTFSGSSGVTSEPASVSRFFTIPLDLYYYSTLDLTIEIETTKKTTVPFYTELVLHNGDRSERSKIQISSDKRTTLSFDLSTFKNRGAIDAIELIFYEDTTSTQSKAFVCNISKISASGSIDKLLSERFLADRFFAAGALTEFSADKRTLTVTASQNDASINAQVTAKPSGDFTNAMRVVMSNDTRSASMRLYYTFSDSEEFTEERSVTVDIRRTTDFSSYILPLQSADKVKRLKIVFIGNSKGTIVISSVSAVCAYTDSTEKIGSITTCDVSDDGKYIIIKGTVKNENSTAYRDCTLALYELSSYEETEAVIKRTTLPTSTHSMSTKFEFRLPLSEANHSALLSKYVVVLYKNGAVIQPLVIVDAPRYVSGTANLAPDIPLSTPSNSFKGVQTSYLSGAQEAGAGRVVIDIPINRLLSPQNSGYLHMVSGKYVYFDSDYVNSLDREIRAYTSGATEVILNLVITEASEQMPFVYSGSRPNVKYYALNVSNLQGELYAGAVVDFLSLRYNGSDGMSISGFILGKKIDLASEFNHMGQDVRLDVYAKNYMRALRLVYTTAQSRNAGLSVYVPISDWWRRDVIYGTLAKHHDTTLLLEAMTALVSAEGAFEWRLLCHSERNAFGLNEGDTINIKDESKTRNSAASGFIGTDSIDTLTTFLGRLNEQYRTAPSGTLYFWQPNIAQTGKLLTPLYSYNYYKLLSTIGVEGFVVSFNVFGSPSGDGHSFLSLKNQIKYIDTPRSSAISRDALTVFEAANWNDAITGFRSDKLTLRNLSEVELSNEMPNGIKGSYHYWDFSDAVNSLGWMPGEYCNNLTVTTTDLSQKALVCSLDGGRSEYDEYMGIYHIYPYTENLSITPWITFDLRAICTDGSEDRLEIFIVVGSGSDRIEAWAAVNSGERVSLTMDLNSFSSKKTAKYVKIWVRGMGEGLENARLELYKVTGHSKIYEGSSLAKAISDERQKAAESSPIQTNKSILIIAIIGGTVVISLIFFLSLGKKGIRPKA